MNQVTAAALCILIALSATKAFAQTSTKLEAGLGLGAGSISAGLAVRGAIAVEGGGWGGLVRAGGHVGQSTCNPCFLGIPNPEVVREVALLVRRGLGSSYPARFSVGLGLGVVSGDRDDPRNPDRLIDIPRTLGAAFEGVVDFGNRRGWGTGLAIQGNVNGESSFVGLILFGSLRLGGSAG